ncbi:MAG TPA: plastocyanin/azurin family copper-binding protein [Gaiellaceae bacterium]|nr:plastocyanin/azurin family copper-binding protein [Gaiellaceae bacterium]
MLLLGLSTGHKVGLALVAAGFAGFALLTSMLVPRWRPQFPGRGLGAFVVACLLLFGGMVTAVVIFGRESGGGEAEAAGKATTAARHAGKPGGQTVKVSEVEWKIKLPKTTFAPGTYTFDVSNDGKVPHNLTVQGPGGKNATPDLGPGKSGTLKVDLKAGAYDFYCSVPGHKQLGMDETVKVS